METEYLERLIETEARSKSNSKRLDEQEVEIKETRELVVAVKEIATEVKHIREDQTKMDKRVTQIEEKPSKNWDKIVSTIIGTVVGAVASGFICLIIK